MDQFASRPVLETQVGTLIISYFSAMMFRRCACVRYAMIALMHWIPILLVHSVLLVANTELPLAAVNAATGLPETRPLAIGFVHVSGQGPSKDTRLLECVRGELRRTREMPWTEAMAVCKQRFRAELDARRSSGASGKTGS